MKHFTLTRYSSLPQESTFHISTDVENFHKIMPDYFKSLELIKQTKNEKIVLEKINFLGITLKIKTKHVINKPSNHEIYILSGPTKGTVFVESYVKSKDGTLISIDVKLRLNGFFKLFSFLENYLANQMSSVMDTFVESAERFNSQNLLK